MDMTGKQQSDNKAHKNDLIEQLDAEAEKALAILAPFINLQSEDLFLSVLRQLANTASAVTLEKQLSGGIHD